MDVIFYWGAAAIGLMRTLAVLGSRHKKCPEYYSGVSHRPRYDAVLLSLAVAKVVKVPE